MIMHPNAGTPFEDIPEPSHEEMETVRFQAEKMIPQMKHCSRCRADAVGLLDQDCSEEFREELVSCAEKFQSASSDKPYVAVATLEGVLVNLHLGHAHEFHIWSKTDSGFEFIEKRPAPEVGLGTERWTKLAEVLHDCRAVLVENVGETPRAVLSEHNVIPVEMSGLVEMGLEAIYNGTNLAALKARRKNKGCSRSSQCGDGTGCG
jgi:nitrogen fixation protein NifB